MGDGSSSRADGGEKVAVSPSSSSGATPDASTDQQSDGATAVYVGAERRRFVVPTAYLGAPAFRRLLEKAEEEFGFHHHGGALTIPCDTEAFKYILLVTDRQVLAHHPTRTSLALPARAERRELRAGP